jgi:tetratricopeptide (TPR) repeat protein
MKSTPCLMLPVIAVILILMSGCATTKPGTVDLQRVPESAPPPGQVQPNQVQPGQVQSDVNSLYYYAESQLQVNKGRPDRALAFMQQAIERDPDSMFLKRELALLYWQAKESEAAEAVMDALVSEDPDNVENLITHARIKHSLNRLDEAKTAYEKIIAADPAQKNIYLLLGELYVDEGSPEFALQIYRSLVKQFPDFFVGYYLMGRVLYLTGDPVEAEKNFKKALDLDPGFDEARYDLIGLYKNPYPESVSGSAIKKRPPQDKKIVELYREILNRNPDDIRAAMELGFFHHEKGRAKNAKKLLKALGERSKTNKHVIQYVIELYVNNKNFESALVVLEYMQKGAPESSGINYIMGLAYDGKNDREAVIGHFKRIDPESTFFKNAVVHTVFLYQEAKETEAAIGFLEDIISRQPHEPEFYLFLGTLYEESRLFENAEVVLKQGLTIEPNNSKLHFRIGVVYDKWGKKEDSIRMMQEVIRLDPEDANALNYLGYTYADMGKNLDEAENLIKSALRLKPDDGYIMDSLGWVYFRKGIYDKALEILEKATTIVPDDPVILEHLGDAYLKNNDREKALEHYQKSMTKADDGKERLGNKIKDLKKSGN